MRTEKKTEQEKKVGMRLQNSAVWEQGAHNFEKEGYLKLLESLQSQQLPHSCKQPSRDLAGPSPLCRDGVFVPGLWDLLQPAMTSVPKVILTFLSP